MSEKDKPIVVSASEELADVATDEPPVVARLVVEIRSDGSRTIARGALEERESGQTVAIEARGDSPMQLAYSLAKMIASAPSLARTAARAMLADEKKPRHPSRSRAGRLLSRIRASASRRRGGGDKR